MNKKKKIKNEYLYNKFLNTYNYFQIKDMATRRKYFNTFFFLNTVTYVPIFLITMCGYDFSFEPNYTIYFFCCFFIYFLLLKYFFAYTPNYT